MLLRYRVDETDDGLHGKEGTFLACTFWLAECLARQGRSDEAREVFDRVASTSNDLGLFAEEYDTRDARDARQLPAGADAPLAHRRRRRPRTRTEIRYTDRDPTERKALIARSARAKIPRIRLHDLRHTHATLPFRREEHQDAPQEMGHSDVGVT